MKKTIDWKKVWDDFEEWLISTEKPTCKTCDHKDYGIPDWEEQQEKIQRLVNAQVRELMKKKT